MFGPGRFQKQYSKRIPHLPLFLSLISYSFSRIILAKSGLKFLICIILCKLQSAFHVTERWVFSRLYLERGTEAESSRVWALAWGSNSGSSAEQAPRSRVTSRESPGPRECPWGLEEPMRLHGRQVHPQSRLAARYSLPPPLLLRCPGGRLDLPPGPPAGEHTRSQPRTRCGGQICRLTPRPRGLAEFPP